MRPATRSGMISQVGRRAARAVGVSRRALSGVAAAEGVVFPAEGYGNEYATNWAVASCGVSLGDKKAFRNPRFKTVCAYSSDPLDKASRMIKRTTVEASLFTAATFDKDTFSDIAEAAREAVTNSASPAAFLVDASASGSSRPSVNVRAVTDDAAMALVLQTLLCGAPKRPAQAFVPHIHFVHSSAPDEAADGAYAAVYGTQVACRGQIGATVLSRALATAAAASVELTGAVGLAGHAVVDSATGEVTLVLGHKPAPKVSKGSSVVFQNNVIWSPEGVSRMWGAMHVVKEKALPESVFESASGLAVSRTTAPSLLAHPSKVIFASGGTLVEALPSASMLGGTEREIANLNALVESTGAQLSFA